MVNKKTLFLVSFLMVLYTAPVIFVATVPTTESTNNNFLISSEPWLDGWDYRREINITGASGAGANYQINLTVYYNGTMEEDFEDIRFTDDDKITLLDYWLEWFFFAPGNPDSRATFWIEVKDNLDTNQTIYMYYGNDAVSTTSNGTETMLFFDDFEDEDLTEWYTAGGYWSTQGAEVKRGDFAAYADAGAALESRKLFANISAFGDADFMVHMWARREVESSSEYFFRGTDTNAGSVYALRTSGTNDFKYDNGVSSDWEANTAVDDTWIELEIAIDYTSELYKFWRDGSYIDAQYLKDTNGVNITEIGVLEFFVDTTAGEDLWLDDCYARKYTASEPVSSFGAEEEYVPPVSEWQVGAIVTVWINTPLFAGTLDMLLIFGGLILIPASTLYAVKGGREEMNTDKLFYVLIAFVIGWALVLGGIYA